MSFLDRQWFEHAFEALIETFNVSGAKRKEMIQFLYDEGFWDENKLSWDSAESRFRDCCNRNKPDANWKVGELWALMKRFDRHQFALAMMEDLGYETRRLATHERQQALLERAVAALERHEDTAAGLRADIERLLSEPTLNAPRTNGLPRPSFSKRAEKPCP